MFQLVQRGIALTPAEKMRAMSTEWAAFTKQYEDDYSLIVNCELSPLSLSAVLLTIAVSKQNRASGFRLVLTIFTMIQEVMTGRKKRSSAPTLQASPQSLLRVLDDKTPINPVLKLKFKAIFDRYETLVKLSSTQMTTTRFKVKRNSVFDPAPDYLREAGINHVRTFSPLELIATAILIAVRAEKSTNEELLDDIKEMRFHLRIKHKDLRVNAQCWITVWEFITDVLDRRRSGKSASASADGASPAVGGASEAWVAQSTTAASSSTSGASHGLSSATSNSGDGPDEQPDEKSSGTPVILVDPGLSAKITPPASSSPTRELSTRAIVSAGHSRKATSTQNRPRRAASEKSGSIMRITPDPGLGDADDTADASRTDAEAERKSSSSKRNKSSRKISRSFPKTRLKGGCRKIISSDDDSALGTPHSEFDDDDDDDDDDTSYSSSQRLKRARSFPHRSQRSVKKRKKAS